MRTPPTLDTEDPDLAKFCGRMLWILARLEHHSGRRLIDALRSGDLPLSSETRAAYDELCTTLGEPELMLPTE